MDLEEQIFGATDRMHLNKRNSYKGEAEGNEQFKSKLIEKLQKDIADNRFLVYLQPQINLKTDEIGGVEALVRYLDEEGKVVPPVSFIGKYETEGIINYLDLHMLEMVCALIKKWRERGKEINNISVNFSRVTMMVAGIVKKILSICNRYEVLPEQITIEVTESIGLLERRELKTLLETLQKEGFKISLDDFGSRYSDLAILSITNFNEIKLDKSLVDTIESKSKSRTIAGYVLQMCMGLELSHTIAEGIENISQKEILKQLGCEYGQGYLFDRPLPVDEFEKKYLKERRKSDEHK
ncbi:EAL domain-containing protein (putative c-di-GMP-specific phosphodiesterase class I) [Aequitasia blattaphilus]|uniref:EAL domain-containing protein n=1 Tax=Aequitasia blattaphilus TaxID=2949332 RepID=A0ABT1E9I9_9FIRM|nr:EAL domain-containing protein [Aequitasia blattaphilus]MCP1102500.1 EAL domain-containing protein [Aequitasia blattaphilus]MCR8615140.1 EAL domain-containing protein [Aequitasia blattaphilus]